MKNLDIPSHIKKTVVEPKVFSLLIKFDQGQFLYTGAHNSLEDAYSAAMNQVNGKLPFDVFSNTDIILWNSVSARKILEQVIDTDNIAGNKKINFSDVIRVGIETDPKDVASRRISINREKPVKKEVQKKAQIDYLKPPTADMVKEFQEWKQKKAERTMKRKSKKHSL